MDSTSNKAAFLTLTADYPAVRIASGTAINTTTLIVTGKTTVGSVVLDVLFRNLDASNIRNFDIIICTTGAQSTAENNMVQVAIPASAGNNGSIPLASLAALAPSVFDMDLAGNRVITLEGTWSIYVVNKAALTADMFIRVKRRNF